MPHTIHTIAFTKCIPLSFSSRTQDKAILEAAYNANPKPDKAARLDIVSRVSLNEKEVQVSLVYLLGQGCS